MDNMKNLKGLVALVLAMVMVASLCSVALAADPAYKITVNNTNTRISIEGKTYNAYKIFDAVYGEGTAVSYTISSTSHFYTDTDAKAALDVYFDFTPSANDSTKIVVTQKDGVTYNARALADALEGHLPTSSDGNGTGSSATKAEITVPSAGYYLVTGIVKPAAATDNSQDVVTAVALVPVKDANATTSPKADVPPLEKKITAVKENGTAVDADLLDTNGKAAVAKVGSVVEFELKSIAPDLTGYDDYTYTFTDTMTSGLTYGDNAKVYIGTATDPLAATAVNYTKNTNGFTLKIPFATLKTLTPGANVFVRYSATVNSTALTYDHEKNTANLEYSNNPDDTTTNHTPDQETYVLDINVDVNKYTGTDPATGNKLAGASFKLFKGTERTGNVFYKWDTTANKVTWVAEANADVFTTGNTGALAQQIRGLDVGTYSLLETVAPSGYNLLTTPIKITISAAYDGTTKKVTYTSNPGTVTGGVVALGTQHEAQPVDTIDVLNQAGTELPETGGIGTTLFYIAGVVMVLGAAAIMVARRKSEQE